MSRGILHELSPADREALLAIGGRRRVARGERLMYEGQPATEVLVLLDGRVKVTMLSPANVEMVLAFRGPGDVIGDLALFDGAPRSASVSALEDVEALALDAQAFRAYLDKRPQVLFTMLKLVSLRLRQADAMRREFAAADATGRVAARLVELAADHGVPDPEGGTRIDLPLSQEDLAGWCGASLESTARALRTLREPGWVSTGRRSVVVRDEDALRQRAAQAL